jgi:hypothetical protein
VKFEVEAVFGLELLSVRPEFEYVSELDISIFTEKRSGR